MKIGERMAVQIEGTDVAEAIVEDIDLESGNATLIIPATRLVVRMRQSLDLNATKEPEVDRVFGGLETAESNASDAGDAANNNEPVAPPAEPVTAPPGIGATYSDDVGEGIHGKQHFPGEMD